tara:strand:- start:53 stop:433 length:381 start_codon:yes stop_codon:yes gene_type:complete
MNDYDNMRPGAVGQRSNVVVKQDIEVDETKVDEMEQKKPRWRYSGKFSTMDYKMNARDKEEHINYILYKEIDISLDIACDFAVEMLTEFDVDDDKLCELVGHFIQAKASLKCYGDAFDKLEQAIQS